MEPKDRPERFEKSVSAKADAQKVFFEQLNLAYAQAPLGIAGSLLTGLAFIYTHRDIHSVTPLVLWSLALLLTGALRMVLLVWRAKSRPTPSDNTKWNILFLTGTAVSGCVWGASFIWLFAETSLSHQVFHVMLVICLSIGAVATYSYVFWNIIVFITPSLASAFVTILPRHEDDVYHAMVFVLVVALAVILSYARRLHKTVESNFVLRFENEELAGRMAAANRKTEELNARLKTLYHTHKTTLENSPAGILNLNREMRVAYMNPAMKTMLGLRDDPQDTYAGKRLDDISSVTHTAMDMIAKPMEDNEANSFEIYHVFGDDDQVYLSVTAVPLEENGGTEGVILLAIDVTERRKAQNAMESFAHEMASILGNMQDAVFRVDINGLFSYMTPSIENLVGLTPGDLVGSHISSVYLDPADHDNLLKLVETGNGFVRDFETRLRKKDGSSIYVSINAQRYCDSIGIPVGIEGAIRDITKRKKYEAALMEALREEEAVFAAMPDIFYLFDMDGRLVKWNKKMETLTGLGPESLKGRHVLDFVPEEQKFRFSEAITEVLKQGFHWEEGDLVGAGGVLLPHQFSGVGLKDEKGNYIGLAGIGRDMTKKKEEERALINAKLTAEEATRLKDKFISLVSHDLRSPIASVIGYLEMVTRNGETSLGENHRALMERTIRILHGLLRMIDKLLTISMIQAGKIVLHKRLLNARAMVSTVIESVFFMAQKKGVKIENQIPESMRLYADAGLLSEVVRNLLSNAVKFTKEGGKITVFAPPGKEMVIAVRDSGIGINEQMLKNIFRHDVKTTRAGTSGETGGGLGLPLCKDIMDAHQGSITAQSKEGEGTVFYVELPLIRPAVAVFDAVNNKNRAMGEAIEELGADLLELGSGDTALEAVKNSRPHIIFMNADARASGWGTLLSAIKNDSELSQIHVMALVEGRDNRMKETALNMGADAVLNKLTTAEDLKLLIGSHILETG